MTAKRLQHYNLITHCLTDTIRFYSDLLGLKSGPLPGGEPDDGAWMYDVDGTAIVHIQAVIPGDPRGRLTRNADRLGTFARSLDTKGVIGTNAIEHVAFECDDFDGFKARFDAARVPIQTSYIERLNLWQIFVDDPNGVLVELNFG